LVAFETNIGIDHVCIIAITAYQDDNRSLVDALERLKGKGRGIAVVGLDVSDAELDEMHKVGVRGIRYNLHTTLTKMEKADFARELHAYANKIRRLNWVIQLFVTMDQIGLIAEEIPKLGVDVVIDHLGAPDSTKAPQGQPGYAELMDLLRKKQVYVKLSGIYRFCGEDMPGLDAYVREILRDARSQVVWASDRPHPGGAEWNVVEGDRWKLQDYRKIDIPAFVTQCREWCDHDEETTKMIFVDNPRRLWRYNNDD
jgi:predicted TIM-barrel fold metal-dependent hydrolase